MDRCTEQAGGVGNLRELQALVERTWRPDSTYHIGDLAWERFHLPRPADFWTTRVWREGGRPVGWAMVAGDGALHLLVDPARPDVADAVVRWAVRAADGRALSATVSESETAVLGALSRAGFSEETDAPFFLHMVRSLDGLPPRPSRPGVTFRPSRGHSDLERLLAGHRAAWVGSGMTMQSLLAVTRAWPYEPRWHWMAEDAAGRVLAEAVCWWDRTNRVGELEPVGTHRDHRRRGLAQALLVHVLYALREAGATRAVVYARGDDAYPVPRALYAGLGFVLVTRTRTLTRPAG